VKKVFLWLLVISMIAVFSLAGCKEEAAEEEVAEEEVAEEEVAEEEVAEEEEVVEVDPASFVGEISLMTFMDEMTVQGPNGEPTMVEMFNEVYPNITVNITKVPSGEMVERINTVLSAGTGIPDVWVGEQSWVLKWINADVWENLSAAPYNADALAEDHFEYVKDLARDADGNLRALTHQATPGALFYRRSMAQEVFGVSEPDEVAALVSDWDSYIETGMTIRDELGGYMTAGPSDIQRYFFFAKQQPWVVDGALVVEDVVLNYLDVAKTIRDENLDAGADMWSAEWSGGMNGNTFTYSMPTWGLFFVIEPTITEPAEPAEGVEYSFGDWGLTHGPASYMWGGTWQGISKTSENKDLAWEFVKYLTTNKEFLQSWSELRGDFTSDIAVDEIVAATSARPSLGGQNHMQYFLDEAIALSDSGWASRITEYDEDVQQAFLSALGDYVNGNTTRDEAIQAWKDAVAALYPEITVE